MKFTTAALVVVLSMVVPLGAGAQVHLPELCAKSPNPPSSAFHCPTPYVELVAAERDLLFDRAWHCPRDSAQLGPRARRGRMWRMARDVRRLVAACGAGIR